jgi:ribosome-associated toxin RatA of RatAB toxin-antitoxin module
MWPHVLPLQRVFCRVHVLRAASVCLAIAAIAAPNIANAQGAPNIEISPDPTGNGGRVRARILIPAPPRVVWAVMVDCANAPRFVPGLRSCRVESTNPAERSDIRVHHISWLAGFPTLSVRFQSHYEQEREIRFERISGDVARMAGVWRFASRDNGQATELSYDASLAPSPLLPSALVRAGLRRDTPKILEAVRAEALRQSGAGQ